MVGMLLAWSISATVRVRVGGDGGRVGGGTLQGLLLSAVLLLVALPPAVAAGLTRALLLEAVFGVVSRLVAVGALRASVGIVVARSRDM